MTEVQTTPKERPILFSAEMVRAILDGRKTQTRRLLESDNYARYYFPFEGDFDDDGWPMACWRATGCLTRITSPFGVAGDRLWVREAWGYDQDGPHTGPLVYRATTPDPDAYRWRPSIHMFRSDSRIDLDVASIRVERLQTITDADAIAEGIEKNWIGNDCPPEYADEWRNYSPRDADGFPCFNPRDSFKTLWDVINGTRASWAANPWVWVVEFRRIRP